jgi:hypothetical protein
MTFWKNLVNICRRHVMKFIKIKNCQIKDNLKKINSMVSNYANDSPNK